MHVRRVTVRLHPKCNVRKVLQLITVYRPALMHFKPQQCHTAPRISGNSLICDAGDMRRRDGSRDNGRSAEPDVQWVVRPNASVAHCAARYLATTQGALKLLACFDDLFDWHWHKIAY